MTDRHSLSLKPLVIELSQVHPRFPLMAHIPWHIAVRAEADRIITERGLWEFRMVRPKDSP